MKSAPISGHLQYRCRRCESLLDVGGSVDDIEGELSEAPEYSQHRCDDGGFGFLDLVGARPSEASE